MLDGFGTFNQLERIKYKNKSLKNFDLQPEENLFLMQVFQIQSFSLSSEKRLPFKVEELRQLSAALLNIKHHLAETRLYFLLLFQLCGM